MISSGVHVIPDRVIPGKTFLSVENYIMDFFHIIEVIFGCNVVKVNLLNVILLYWVHGVVIKENTQSISEENVKTI